MTEHKGEYMNNYGSINPNDVATLSLLGGGYGYGRGRYVGDEVLAANSHADGSAVASKIDSVNQNVSGQNDHLRDLMRDRQFNDLQTSVQGVREELARVAGDNRFEMQVVLRELQKSNCDLAKQIADCCCETQKETIAQGTATRELINQRALDDAQRALDAADRQNNTNQIVNAVLQGNGCHGRGNNLSTN